MGKSEARIRWTRLVAGFALVVVAGTSAAGASGPNLDYWDSWAAGGSVLLGVLLALSAMLGPQTPAPPKSMWGAKGQRLPSGNEHPLLGELLVYKYELITEAQLTKALVRQRATSQPIGEVLIGMGLVTASQIGIALADQRSNGDPFGTAPEGQGPRT